MPSRSSPPHSARGIDLSQPPASAGERIRAATAHSFIEELYRGRTPSSAALMERAAAVMPGGNTRTTSFHPPYPLVIERGEGPWVWDVDKRRYLDLFCNGLSLIHGHAYAPVNAAISDVLPRGSAWSGASREQIAYAELLTDRLETMERLRFTNSGSEAGLLAVKAARHITGRPLIVKAIGAYHGCYEDLEAGLYGRGDLAGRALVAPFNDLDGFERVMRKHGSNVAALVIEPVLVTGRVVAPEPGFLNALEKLAQRHGALTILDDCLMLRLAVGGSSEKFGLRPDITVLGKFLGGGTAFGAFGGSRDIMKIFEPTRAGTVFHGGSFNGNLIGCAAGLVTMRELTKERIGAMDAACARLRETLAERAGELGLEIVLSGIGSVLGIAFAADPRRHEDDPSALGLASLFHLACANEGLMIGPGGILTVSTVHDEPAISFAADALSAALERIAELVESL